MKQFFAILLLGVAPWLYAQEKGLQPLQSVSSSDMGSTYAVVVGITDYQDPGIPDLRFADKDAMAFVNFLRSPAGGSLNEDHLKVLLNSEATAAQFAIALDWLWEVVKENDRVIIYFSGHGDVERKSLTQPGYLLCWDAPSRVYLGGGALALPMFQDVISTLSIQNKGKVIVIMDACHAGKLSGSAVGGAQLTNSNLAKQYANEIKILSCQPDEYSIEGEQWGGGRGAFSFHLLDGLYGMADANNDGSVNLKEISRYLEDMVSEEVAPQYQNPMTIGSVTEKLTDVFPEILALLQEGKKGQLQLFAATESRGIEDDVLAAADSNLVELYFAFQKALKDKQFFEPATASADVYYGQLRSEPQLEKLQSTMRRNYAASLQDDAQQAMNIWLAAEVQQLECIGKSLRLDPIPRQLGRAADLLGEGHYMYRSLQARKLLFEGVLEMNHNNPDEALGQKCLSIFRQSLALEPNSALPWHRMSLVYANNLRMPDSAFVCVRRAHSLAPNWVLPYADLGYVLSQQNNIELAKQALQEAEAIDSLHPYVINRWAIWLKELGGIANLEKAAALFEKYRESGGALYPCWFNDYGNVLSGLGRHAESEAKYFEGIAIDSTNLALWNNLAGLYNQTNRFDESEPVLKKVIALDSTDAFVWNNLGLLYLYTGRYAEGESAIKQALVLDSTISAYWNNLGGLYNETRRYAESEPVLKKAIMLDSTNTLAWSNLGGLYLDTRRYSESEQVLKRAIALDSTNTRAWNTLGFLYNDTHRYAEAEQTFQLAISLDSTNIFSWNTLGLLYFTTRRYTEAEQIYKQAISLDSTISILWDNLGKVYQGAGHYAEAEQHFKKAIALDSTFIVHWNNLGFLYLITRRYAEAEQIFWRVVQMDSTSLSGWNNLGNIYQETNRFDESEKMYRKAFSVDSDFMWTYFNYAILKSKMSDLHSAFSFLEQAIQRGYDDYQGMQTDAKFAPLLEQKEQWDALMKKYFADKMYYNLACDQSLKGELDKAFEALEMSLTSGWKDNDWMQQDTDLTPLREQKARWEALMQKYFPEQAKE